MCACVQQPCRVSLTSHYDVPMCICVCVCVCVCVRVRVCVCVCVCVG